MANDLEAGNRLELDWLAGKVVALGRKYGVRDADAGGGLRDPEALPDGTVAIASCAPAAKTGRRRASVESMRSRSQQATTSPSAAFTPCCAREFAWPWRQRWAPSAASSGRSPERAWPTSRNRLSHSPAEAPLVPQHQQSPRAMVCRDMSRRRCAVYGQRIRNCDGMIATPCPASASASRVCGVWLSRNMFGLSSARRHAASKDLPDHEARIQQQQGVRRKLANLDRARACLALPTGDMPRADQHGATKDCRNRWSSGSTTYQPDSVRDESRPRSSRVMVESGRLGQFDLVRWDSAARSGARNVDSTLSMCCGEPATFSTPVSPRLKRLRPLPDRAGVVQQATTIADQLLAFAGQHQPAANPVEQLQAEFLFEPGDLPRQRWLGDAQPQGGLRDGAEFGHG